MKNGKVIVPPIKIQGIKTKLIPFIISNIYYKKEQKWIEPFLGSGSVAFNVKPKKALLADINPYIIKFYQDIQQGIITSQIVKNFLQDEGDKLKSTGGEHYYLVRNRFNTTHDPLDFLFLVRSSFNGLMRFNSSGGYNVPFCKKPGRFAPALITKICNQVDIVAKVIRENDYTFQVADWRETVKQTSEDDFIFIDSPYINRSSQYLTTWSDKEANDLEEFLKTTDSKFALTMWESNKYRKNEYIDKFNYFNKKTTEHFYHVGSKEDYRNKIIEALIYN